MLVASVIQKCNILNLRTITLICTRSKKQHVVMRAKFTAFAFSESVGNGTEVLIQKLLRFFFILMRPAISFFKSKNFQLFVKKKFSLLYPDRIIWKGAKPLECLSCTSSDAENSRSAGLFWLEFHSDWYKLWNILLHMSLF